MVTAYQLHERCWKGLHYFEDHLNEIGSPKWKEFKEDVLYPYSYLIGEHFGSNGDDVMRICKKVGGLLVHPGRKILDEKQ